ncbi:hypothetical protein L1049_021363 [Liquidambar formosana]|uniref:F-box domain-containing protein n=1 Tax=Liquidambar formosana TaxID=63359 RepID=A0AAP0SEE3_LIQFO
MPLMKELPNDVIFDILSRLPVKAIIRFRCVSKSWYATITHPSFITTHLNLNLNLNLNRNHTSSYNHGYLQYSMYDPSEKSKWCVFSDQSYVNHVGFETPFNCRPSYYLKLVGSVNGSPQEVNLSFVNGDLTGGVETLRQVEAKYPALLFKQQLTAYVEKIYGMIQDNLKKEISPLLGLCIQASRTSRASLVKGSSCSVANSAAQQALIAHWQGIVTSLGNFLNTLKENHVPLFLVHKVFTQIFSFINVQLFNSLLLRRECCSFSNGEYVKAGLAELEHLCYKATDEYAGSAWDELKHIKQAIGFLVIHQKPKKTLDEISHDLCPVLSIQQLYRISTMYWDDKYVTHSVSLDVISSMRVLMTEDSNNAASNSFLLDDDSSIPFSVDDISKSMEQIDISDIEPPPLIHENSGSSFLLPRAE